MKPRRPLLEVLRPTGLPILSEEMGADASFSLDRDGWIIDPLDGTMNFVRGIPVSCTCCGVVAGGASSARRYSGERPGLRVGGELSPDIMQWHDGPVWQRLGAGISNSHDGLPALF